jgi:hypothetical protein
MVCGFAVVGLLGSACSPSSQFSTHIESPVDAAPAPVTIVDRSTPESRRLAEAAMAQVGRTVSYDPAYVQLEYPGGDVPIDTGVCTDVVVRAFREMGLDLQVAVHEDMRADFSAYPDRWGLSRPDPNIDHRRVPNLEAYFDRQGKRLPVSQDGQDYLPGDLVTWDVYGRPHIGIVSTEVAPSGDRWLIAHNIGRGASIDDVLFQYEITGHFRYYE